MEFLVEYWFLIIIGLVVVAYGAFNVYMWYKKPSKEQILQVKTWVLFAVMKAENILGSKTGKLKLLYVYDLFGKQFPTVSKFIPFSVFETFVEEALIEMKRLMSSNAEIKFVIENKEEKLK